MESLKAFQKQVIQNPTIEVCILLQSQQANAKQGSKRKLGRRHLTNQRNLVVLQTRLKPELKIKQNNKF